MFESDCKIFEPILIKKGILRQNVRFYWQSFFQDTYKLNMRNINIDEMTRQRGMYALYNEHGQHGI